MCCQYCFQSVGNYEFAYNEDHATGGSFRKEKGSSYGPVIGSYGLREVDGRVRVVSSPFLIFDSFSSTN